MRSETIDASIIDVPAFIGRLDGDSELIAEVLQLFFVRKPGLMAALRQSVESRDFLAIERSAHALRGYFLSFHAQRASEAVLALEIRGRQENGIDIDRLLPAFEHEVEVLMPVLSSLSSAQAGLAKP